nr:MAG TPA: hypothetical protein [Caudoviricetes sp.]
MSSLSLFMCCSFLLHVYIVSWFDFLSTDIF